jgi:hydroxypyruvate isomerase
MPNFSANLWYLFQEWDMMERFAVAARAGFRAVEFHFPYQWAAAELSGRLTEHGLEQVLINAPAGDWDAGERGLAGLPGRQGEFADSIGLAIDYARALACPRIHVMAGLAGDDAGRARDTLAENLSFAAGECARHGIAVLIEALNPTDVPGYLIADTAEALSVLECAGHGNLYLQYDLYHAAMNGEDMASVVRDNLDVIGHMQVAGVPGRHEPDEQAAIDYAALFRAIDDMGYAGWIGCEYSPRTTTLEGLGWM